LQALQDRFRNSGWIDGVLATLQLLPEGRKLRIGWLFHDCLLNRQQPDKPE